MGVRGLDGDSIFDMASERERARAMNVFWRFPGKAFRSKVQVGSKFVLAVALLGLRVG